MAYYDILAGDSYGRYNKKLAKLAGLPTAVYWSTILNIITKVVKKQKFDSDGFFTISRKFVEEETALSEEDQLACDAALRNLGVLDSDPDDSSKVRVRLEQMTAILVEDDLKDLKLVSKAAKVSRADKAEGKRIGIINRLKGRVNEQDEELVKLYGDLIEACYGKITTNAQIDLYQETINKYTDDIKVKKEIVKIGAVCGYKMAEWAIQQYEKQKGKPGTRLSEQKTCTEINKDITF